MNISRWFWPRNFGDTWYYTMSHQPAGTILRECTQRLQLTVLQNLKKCNFGWFFRIFANGAALTEESYCGEKLKFSCLFFATFFGIFLCVFLCVLFESFLHIIFTCSILIVRLPIHIVAAQKIWVYYYMSSCTIFSCFRMLLYSIRIGRTIYCRKGEWCQLWRKDELSIFHGKN